MIKFNRPFDLEQLRLLIFDLDGTLIDSRLDLVYSINAMRRHFDLPELSGEVIAGYVGDGAAMLVRRSLGEDSNEKVLKEAGEYFLNYYLAHKLDHTKLYEGVLDMLAAAGTSPGGSRRQLAILSNKPLSAALGIIEGLGIASYFVSVCGGNSFGTQKPDPLGARTIMTETGNGPEQTMIIGDSSNDIRTGRNAGAWTGGVTYGFAPHTLSVVTPDVVVDTPAELLAVLTGTVEK